MTREIFIDTKGKPSIIFIFALVAMGIFSGATVFATDICGKWDGIVFGVVLMLLAIPFHIWGKKNKVFYVFSFLLNSLGNAFSVSSYYVSKNLSLNFKELAYSSVVGILLLFIVFLFINFFPKVKTKIMIVAVSLNVVLLITWLVLLIIRQEIFFSFGFFSLIITAFYIGVYGVSANHPERSVFKDISYGSFGTFIIITLVVIFILSEGEILEGLDFGTGETRKKKAKK